MKKLDEVPVPPKGRIVNESHPMLLVVLLIVVVWIISTVLIVVARLR